MTYPNLEHYSDFLRGEEKSSTQSYSNADSDGSSSGLFSDDSEDDKYLLSMYFYAIHKYNLRSITHKYFIQGHTQNEGDSVHSVIEKQVKRHLGSKPIYTPDQYTTLIATAKKTGLPYRVHELSHDEFYDMKSLQEEWAHNFILNEANQKVNWRNIKVLRVENGNTDSFLYKTSYKDTDFIKVCVDKNNLKPTTYWNSHKLLPAYMVDMLPLSAIKKRDLSDLVKKNIIPKQYFNTYYKYLIDN